MNIHYDLRGTIALLRLDFPPVNGIGFALRAALQTQFRRAVVDDDVRCIVVTGSGRAFSAGADIKEFNTPAATREPRLADLIREFEDSPKPVIAAISGVCMGGGFELALGAHYRVAHSSARIALPEVKLGLMPGAGGTQRLPRATNVETALRMIVGGESVHASALQQYPLFDLVTMSDPVEAAIELGSRIIATAQPLKRLRDKKVDDPSAFKFLQAARHSEMSKAARNPARLQCVEAVSWSIDTPFDEALQQERDSFAQLLASPESRALRHSFTAERRAARIDELEATTPQRKIESVGVVGAGTMGTGIAMAFMNAAIPVVLLELTEKARDRGLAIIRENYEVTASKGKLRPEDVHSRMSLVNATCDFERLSDCDLVIEAVYEEMGAKEAVFRKLDTVCKSGAILASNTSYLNIDIIASFTDRPDDVVGLHFFSPAHVMRLLEVVRASKTAPDVLLTCVTLARRLNKIGVVAGLCDGFIGNRMIFRYTAAAFDMVAAGASPAQVDNALESFGMAMGPLRMGDLAGLELSWATRKRRAAEAGIPVRAVVPDKLCEAGRFGQKTGAGWYRYDAGSRKPIADPETDRLVADFRREQGIVPRQISDDEIVDRCIFALVNEGARVLEERIAARASDIDLVYLNGYGFPAHRGGPMLYADMVGLKIVEKRLSDFATEQGADTSWQPAPLLRRLASERKTFN